MDMICLLNFTYHLPKPWTDRFARVNGKQKGAIIGVSWLWLLKQLMFPPSGSCGPASSPGLPLPFFLGKSPGEEVASGPARHWKMFVGDAWVRVGRFWVYLRGYVSFAVIGYSWACMNMTWSLSLSHRWLIYPEIRSKLKKKVYDRAVKFKFTLLHMISFFRLVYMKGVAFSHWSCRISSGRSCPCLKSSRPSEQSYASIWWKRNKVASVLYSVAEGNKIIVPYLPNIGQY